MARNAGIFYDRRNPANGRITTVYNVHNTVSGWEHEFSNGEGNGLMPGSYNNALARAWDTPGWARVTEGHARAIKAALAAVRETEILGAVQIIPADEIEAAVAGEEADEEADE